MEYHLLRGGFDFGASGEDDAFLADGTPAAVLYDGPDYYNRLWFADRELRLPNTLAGDISAYRALTDGHRRAFARSCYWFAAGLQLASGGFEAVPAFVTAVEALLPKQSGTPCQTCRKLDGPGYRRRFRDFLDRYSMIPPDLEPVQRELYDVRSELVHGAHAGRVDLSALSFAPRSDVHQLALEHFVRRGLVGWLRDPNRTI